MNVVLNPNVTVFLEQVKCGGCGIHYAVPADWLRERQRDSKTFTCPNGCVRCYRKTEADKLREEIEWQKKLRGYDEERIARLEKDKQSLKFKAMAERGHKVRLQKRIAAGVCPCCQRSFQNVAAHMAHMHPEFAKEPLP